MKSFFRLYILLIPLMLLSSLPVWGQETSAPYWEPFFMEDFEENTMGWPMGNAMEGEMSLSRTLTEGDYQWKIRAPKPNFTWIGFQPDYPANQERFHFQTSMRLPDFTPYLCGGILFEGQGLQSDLSFYSFIVCNNKTYSLIRYENGSLSDAIPPTPIHDYDSFSPAVLAVEMNNGWTDLLYNGNLLDTFNTGFSRGTVGLLAMPQSAEETEIRFGYLDLYYTADSVSGRYNAEEVDPQAPESIARMVRMLNMKERIQSTAGRYQSMSDGTMELASMGYFGKSVPLVNGGNLILSADLNWSSAYDKPDYTRSGCGFYLRDNGAGSYVEVYAAMDGAVYVNTIRQGTLNTVMSYSYSGWNTSGSGRLGIAADGQSLTVLWNDAILGTIPNISFPAQGSAGTLIHSGTNLDYGTRCSFTNVEGYVFE